MSGFRIAVPSAVERFALIGAVGLLTAAAWAMLWRAEPHFHGVLHAQSQTNLIGAFHLSHFLKFAVAWTGMSVAMMLPTSLPVLVTLHTFAGERSDRAILIALAAGGYLAAWAVVGLFVGPLNFGMQEALAFPVEPRWIDRAVAPALLLVAGLFQFSAWKYRCLERCRSPLHFVLSHWRGRQQRWQAFCLGWASGVFCVGCCWALMLLMLLSSAGHLVWMLVLGLVMAVEKNVRWGRRLSAPVGFALIGCAGVVFIAGDDRGLLSARVLELCGAK